MSLLGTQGVSWPKQEQDDFQRGTFANTLGSGQITTISSAMLPSNPSNAPDFRWTSTTTETTTTVSMLQGNCSPHLGMDSGVSRQNLSTQLPRLELLPGSSSNAIGSSFNFETPQLKSEPQLPIEMGLPCPLYQAADVNFLIPPAQRIEEVNSPVDSSTEMDTTPTTSMTPSISAQPETRGMPWEEVKFMVDQYRGFLGRIHMCSQDAEKRIIDHHATHKATDANAGCISEELSELSRKACETDMDVVIRMVRHMQSFNDKMIRITERMVNA